uniref:Uncharacterized protein n=1 Tax=Timema douglasi TaxID=61478 RepID=A0A7R8Z7Y4_TIMDO|nr:unnamed protein product [Timema douglasi]
MAPNAITEIKVKDKVVRFKEERKLMQWFIIISKSRTELNLKKRIRTYEFDMLSQSLVVTLLLAYDKASILHQLEKLSSGVQVIEDAQERDTNQEMSVPLKETTIEHTVEKANELSAYRVILNDEMAVQSLWLVLQTGMPCCYLFTQNHTYQCLQSSSQGIEDKGVSHQSPRNNYPHHSHHGGMPLDPPGTYGGLNPHHKGGRGQMVKRRRNNPPRKEYSNMR